MDLKKRRAIRAIRQLAVATPESGINERLLLIAGLAVGEVDPSTVGHSVDAGAMADRVRGKAVAEDPPVRQQKTGKDRRHRGGRNRATV